MSTVQTIAASLIGLAAFGAFLAWNGHRLASQDAAFQAYETCVAAEFGTTPSAFYQSHGYYPECR